MFFQPGQCTLAEDVRSEWSALLAEHIVLIWRDAYDGPPGVLTAATGLALVGCLVHVEIPSRFRIYGATSL